MNNVVKVPSIENFNSGNNKDLKGHKVHQRTHDALGSAIISNTSLELDASHDALLKAQIV